MRTKMSTAHATPAEKPPRMKISRSELSKSSHKFGLRITELKRRDATMQETKALSHLPSENTYTLSRSRLLEQAVKRQRGERELQACGEVRPMRKRRKTKHQAEASIFRFADLPTELRDLICKHVFLQKNGEETRSPVPHLLTALKIDKKLYAPAKKVYCLENEFRWTKRVGWTNNGFMKTLGPAEQSLIRKVRIFLQ